MADIGRRALLLGSGLALALVGSRANSQAPQATTDDDWNHGDKPWDEHPGNAGFKPQKVCILHMELLEDFRIKARRLHYRIAQDGSENTWASISSGVLSWIRALNAGEVQPDKPTERDVFHGLSNFVFGRPHHLIVYIKNENIEFPERPLWFGNMLKGTVMDICREPQTGRARENHSFFNASVKRDLLGLGNDNSSLVHVENHFHKRVFPGRHIPIENNEFRVYSLKINVISQSIVGDVVESRVPIIIDPDTGNMGGGVPHLCN